VRGEHGVAATVDKSEDIVVRDLFGKTNAA
jgi:hypothetical protein